jgi:uncharacterized protein (DUF111 family)
MLLGALIDAGAPVDNLLYGLETLPISGWELKIERVRKGAIAATSVSVIVNEKQPERHLSDIESIVLASQLPEKVKEQSLKVFQLLAEAEAKVHGIGVNEVHFHEVGAVDSIVDIVGSVYALHLLGVQAACAGKRDLPFPNVLRVIVGDMPDNVAFERERLVVVETNLDDMTGEMAGFAMERLLTAGVRDVWVVPAQMKKNRPAIVLSVLCDHEKLPTVLQILLRETTTLGVRVQEVERLCLPREIWEVTTPYGTVKVKVAKLGDEIVNIAPEYEDCRRLALERGVPLKEVMSAAIVAARDRIGKA